MGHDIEVAFPRYNLIEYTDNYFRTSGILWRHYKDEVTLNDDGKIADFNKANVITKTIKEKNDR